ncbi:LysR family transcriptional regulator [Sinimarinibacterium sp. CAU 1509]|uniref:LysR family transcriptional regulator n=1 Tax=Sinimarinibacterium sp. CAU 1509 TaxID=2562283 RepID=UPI0010AD153A|nr:LysR family transcriptional regulator [Sinimarinibacterium sp. CAU 1509]TJY62232.1 LysR family transcriptional regulator [Sinimarinibacterium sp. CAU 1509]
MDTQLLVAFVEVAEGASFTQAAEELHLSQPAVSKRITALEQQIGHPLFDRVGRRVSLTDAGRTLLPYAKKALQDIEDARRALSSLNEDVGGRLSIGTSHHIGLHRLPPVLRSYTMQFPNVDLDIHFMDSEVACESVLNGKLELGIVTLPTQPLPQLEQRLIWPDPMSVVVAPQHPLAGRNNLRLRDLAEHPAVLPDAATYTHRIVTAELQRQGVAPRVRLATNYLETLKMLAGIGLGWSVLPDSMVDDSLCRLSVRGLNLYRELGLVWHQRRTLSGAASALIEQLSVPA